MNITWRTWIVYLTVFDFLAGVGLWRNRRWGEILFVVIAISQPIGYLGFSQTFGPQYFLIIFHVITLGIYSWFLKSHSRIKIFHPMKLELLIILCGKVLFL